VRAHLDATSPRALAVLRPLRVVLTNVPEGRVEGVAALHFPGRADSGYTVGGGGRGWGWPLGRGRVRRLGLLCWGRVCGAQTPNPLLAPAHQATTPPNHHHPTPHPTTPSPTTPQPISATTTTRTTAIQCLRVANNPSHPTPTTHHWE
jgi:hypothetical protein